jgi:hypothetical protein
MPHLKITNYYNAYNALLEIFENKYYLFVYVKFNASKCLFISKSTLNSCANEHYVRSGWKAVH